MIVPVASLMRELELRDAEDDFRRSFNFQDSWGSEDAAELRELKAARRAGSTSNTSSPPDDTGIGKIAPSESAEAPEVPVCSPTGMDAEAARRILNDSLVVRRVVRITMSTGDFYQGLVNSWILEPPLAAAPIVARTISVALNESWTLSGKFVGGINWDDEPLRVLLISASHIVSIVMYEQAEKSVRLTL